MVPTLLMLVNLLNLAAGIDLNSLIPRENCYPTDQPGCSKNLIDEYPDLAWSSTNLTKAETWFFLFTRKNEEKPELLHKCAGALPPVTNFNSKNRLIVIIPPFFLGICDIAIYREWIVQYLIREDCNILVIDYSWGNHADEGTAEHNIKTVAKQAKIVLQKITKRTGLTTDKIYLIGHSLGAQLAGQIGHQFQVQRITGIDPAQPGYAEETPLEFRLDKSDAVLVDIWHTSIGCLPYLGLMYDAGHVDFYINDYHVQNECYEYALTSLLKQDIVWGIGTALIPYFCWHAHAAVFYKVTINPGDCQFVAVKCASDWLFQNGHCNDYGHNGDLCTIMGFDLDKVYANSTHKPSGKYFVKTGLTCPYCDNSSINLEGFNTTYYSFLQKSGDEADSESCDYGSETSCDNGCR